ncbi:MAG: hypothetical protein RLZZ493_1598 [Bacteroidota bacterium]|jgi:hypothetical protein
MDIIYDSLIILAPIWILWLFKNYSRQNAIFFIINVVFFIFSPVILLLALYTIGVVFHYLVLIYIWYLFSYFSVSMLLKKHVVLTSVTIGLAFNSIIIYSIPNKQGQFYYWSYWSDNSYKLNIKTFDKYQIQTDVDTKKIYELVECEIKNKNRIDKWKFKVNYKSDRDTIIDFKHINSYKQKNCRLDFFEFTSFRVPSESSQYKELFDKEIRTFAIISVSGKPERFIEGYGGMKEIIQELMVDFDYYNDYLTFRWENRNFWNNVANSYSDEIKKIEKLKKCS